MRPAVAGLVAGAAGSSALNAVAYADMLVRGRAASRVPDRAAKILAARIGIVLDDHRAEGAGMLLGYADGTAFGIGYALARTRLRAFPWPVAGAALAAATFGPEIAAHALGATDVRTWGIRGWVEGLFPRLAYGLVTAAIVERTLR